MAIAKLEKAEWRAFFDAVSKVLVGKRAEVEVEALALGSQIEAEWLPLLGLTYDPRSDIFEIAFEGFEHVVNRPTEIYVDRDAAGVSSIEVIDGDGVRAVMKLRDPLLLPAGG